MRTLVIVVCNLLLLHQICIPAAVSFDAPQASTNLMIEPTIIMSALSENKDLRLAQKDPKYTKKDLQGIFIKQIDEINKVYSDPNRGIPPKKDTVLRINTYNVHAMADPLGKDSASRILGVLKEINADVVILQEVVLKNIFQERKLKQGKRVIRYRFENLGYKYALFGGGADVHTSNFGNVILSKLPFQAVYKDNFMRGGKHARSFVKVVIDLSAYGKAPLSIYGTHFEVNSPAERLQEGQELVDMANRYDKNNNVVIAADFNETQQGSAIKHLTDNNFKNCFVSANLPEPTFTHWSGKTIDFILLRNSQNVAQTKRMQITGCYLYYSNASDHMPVIMDLEL